MVDLDDWRLQGQERWMRGASLVRRAYRPYDPNLKWNHDHCEFCWAKFMAKPGVDIIAEGYCTEDEHRWVCPTCFNDFREHFEWKLLADP